MYHDKKNIGDYRSATAHLTLLEHGVYNWLLDTYYLNEKRSPKNECAIIPARFLALI